MRFSTIAGGISFRGSRGEGIRGDGVVDRESSGGILQINIAVVIKLELEFDGVDVFGRSTCDIEADWVRFRRRGRGEMSGLPEG